MAERRLRVLLLIDEMEVGGSQRQVAAIASGLDRRRFEAHVGYFRRSSHFVELLRAEGIPVYAIPKRSPIDLGFVWRLFRLLRSGQYDVVHCFSFTAELWTALVLPFCRRAALVTSIRGIYDWYAPWQWRVKRIISRRSRRVVANSKAAARYSQVSGGLDGDSISVVYNGLAEGQAPGAGSAEVRASLGVLPEQILALFVGRVVADKGLNCLVQACTLLGGDSRRIAVRLVGDGPLRATLEGAIATAGLQEVIQFVGERRDVQNLLLAADVFVLPSLRESLSNALLEAMAAGVAVIASDAGGNPELVEDGATGLLFVTGDANELAVGLRRLIADPEYRRRLAASGQASARASFGYQRMCEEMQRIYLAAAAA